jgi:hypothetical protein
MDTQCYGRYRLEMAVYCRGFADDPEREGWRRVEGVDGAWYCPPCAELACRRKNRRAREHLLRS